MLEDTDDQGFTGFSMGQDAGDQSELEAAEAALMAEGAEELGIEQPADVEEVDGYVSKAAYMRQKNEAKDAKDRAKWLEDFAANLMQSQQAPQPQPQYQPQPQPQPQLPTLDEINEEDDPIEAIKALKRTVSSLRNEVAYKEANAAADARQQAILIREQVARSQFNDYDERLQFFQNAVLSEYPELLGRVQADSDPVGRMLKVVDDFGYAGNQAPRPAPAPQRAESRQPIPQRQTGPRTLAGRYGEPPSTQAVDYDNLSQDEWNAMMDKAPAALRQRLLGG